MTPAPHLDIGYRHLHIGDIVIEPAKSGVAVSAKEPARKLFVVMVMVYRQMVGFRVSGLGGALADSADSILFRKPSMVFGLIDVVLFLFQGKAAVKSVVRFVVSFQALFVVAFSAARSFAIRTSLLTLAGKAAKWFYGPTADANFVSQSNDRSKRAVPNVTTDRTGILNLLHAESALDWSRRALFSHQI